MVQFPAGDGNFSLHYSVPNGSGAHPASYPMGTGGWKQSGQGVKLTTHLHLVPRSGMRGAIPPLSQYVFMAWCLVTQRDLVTNWDGMKIILWNVSCLLKRGFSCRQLVWICTTHNMYKCVLFGTFLPCQMFTSLDVETRHLKVSVRA
jgi:hypothetical protein